MPMKALHPLSHEVTAELRDRFRQMLARLDEVRSESGPTGNPGVWRPAIDLGEVEEAILIRVELPGVRPDQVRVTLCDQTLRVEGRKERPAPASSSTASLEERPIRFLCLERGYGNFAFALSLKWQIEVKGLTARLSNGILEIRLPKASHSGREMVIPIES